MLRVHNRRVPGRPESELDPELAKFLTSSNDARNASVSQSPNPVWKSWCSVTGALLRISSLIALPARSSIPRFTPESSEIAGVEEVPPLDGPGSIIANMSSPATSTNANIDAP